MIDVNQAVFPRPPYFEPVGSARTFGERFKVHAARSSVRFLGAFDDGRLIGLAYGYRVAPGQFPHDLTRESLGPNKAAFWKVNPIELMELAILPEFQGNGIGSRLHDRLLEGVHYGTTVAWTIAENNAALSFYRHKGRKILGEDFRFPGSREHQVVIGLELTREQLRARLRSERTEVRVTSSPLTNLTKSDRFRTSTTENKCPPTCPQCRLQFINRRPPPVDGVPLTQRELSVQNVLAA